MKTISEALGVARSNVVERRDNATVEPGADRKDAPAMSNSPAQSAALSTSDQRMDTGGSPRY